MPKQDPLLALVYRISENQNALGSAIAELAAWADFCGSTLIAERARTHLHTLVDNAAPIAAAIHELHGISANQGKVAGSRRKTSTDKPKAPVH